MRVLTWLALFTLLVPILAACAGDDPCFDADKTDTPDDDIRVQLSMDSGPASLVAEFSVSPGPSSGTKADSQKCDPVSTDIASPTNVVFKAVPGDIVRVELTHKNGVAMPNWIECVVTSDAFGPAIGTPGNVFIDAFATGGGGQRVIAQMMCGQGLRPA